MAHIRQSRPDSGLVIQVKVLKTVEGVASSLGSGYDARRTAADVVPASIHHEHGSSPGHCSR